ncbi:helix-turn-helix transcriptional regulator [Streptomyces sp. SP17BM10]|uniref:helix-turn-helix transcriptional regulator n=1 Tax=Streptomyces sp. SP17BM10 TaxID=3002530 RepID=UPI002E7A2D61|nr:helix-turn-helix transcriptional regulator [Streptomyces sp. SP17BM10]MEE1782847.1 helix-turn-helix transcriptional regulator [Streptomyces sp. SP17BM10]
MEGNALAVLGLSPQEEAVYRLLLRSPGIGLAVIAHACGTGEDDAAAALARLRDLGVVRAADDPDTFSSVDPPTAVERLARLRIHGLQSEIRQVASSRHLVDRLAEDQRAGRRATVSELQRVEGLEQVIACVDELSFFARDERLTTHPGPILAAALDAVRASDLKYLRRGLRMRTIVHTDALDCPQVDRYTAELIGQGARVRGTTGPLERMVIFDRRTALVATDPDDITRGALVVRQPGLLAHLLGLFERRWSESCAVPDELPTTAERQVLRVMARVDKDEAGARELGMSLRTYRGHVASLLRRLDVPNRFQAALAARERRWI